MKYFLRLMLLTFIASIFWGYIHANIVDKQFFNILEVSTSQLDTIPQNPLEKFKGEWVLKDNIFESSTNGKYSADVNPNRTFIALAVNTNSSILWSEDFDGFKVDIFWTYDVETKTVYHLSNTSANGLATGKGPLKENGDLDIKLSYPDNCETCNRIYSFRWKSDNEFFFRATFYKDDKPTGDFYGATFIRKK